MKRGSVVGRFALGCGLGIVGLGQIEQTFFPFHVLPLLLGVGLLGAGLILALGTVSAVRRRR